MPILSVYNLNGQQRREIYIPGRSAMRPFGAIQIVGNVGQRRESDWEAIKAAIAAGSVSIQITPYEADVAPQYLQGKLRYGGNVSFDCKKNPQWRLLADEDGAYCSLEPLEYQCVHCSENFVNAFHLNGHMQREHRTIAERALMAEKH